VITQVFCVQIRLISLELLSHMLNIVIVLHSEFPGPTTKLTIETDRRQ
jgi:hypothetical protein